MIENIHWFRNDLRLEDNFSLSEATNSNTLCIFILDESLINKTKATKRLWFLFQSLKVLKENLNKLNSDLYILKLKGDYSEFLKDILKATNAKSLYFNRDYSPYAQSRDEKIINNLLTSGIEVKTFKDYVIYEHGEVLKVNKTPFLVFTPYKNAWLKSLDLDREQIKNRHIKHANLSKTSLLKEYEVDLDEYLEKYNGSSDFFIPGENAANNTWQIFVANKLDKYNQSRDILALTGTSNMSAYIKFGNISIRKLVRDTLDINTLGSKSYISELVWREFYKTIMMHFPDSIKNNYNKKYDLLIWQNNKDKFKDWCEGKTGFLIVDAAMRQLNTTGWMHNRARMIVASFLCKDLHIDWKWGERYFFEKLIDYDISSNVGGWQWTAGTGTDAAPYFRIFNPEEQQKKFDPDMQYIKKYIPDLDSHITNTPLIVDHKTERLKTLELYKV